MDFLVQGERKMKLDQLKNAEAWQNKNEERKETNREAGNLRSA